MAKTLTARQAVKVWLAQHDKTQLWLASELGISTTLLSLVLSGYRSPSDDFLKSLRALTGIDLNRHERAA